MGDNLTPLYRVVVVGDGAVGKSATTIQLCRNRFIEVYDPTIEDTYRHQLIVDNDALLLEIQDTAGQEGFQTLFDRWLRWGSGFLILYSITSRDSFNRVHWFIERIKTVSDQDIFPLVIIGNKNDLEHERVVGVDEGRALGIQYSCTWMEASAKLRRNVEEMFIDVVKQIRDPKRNIALSHPMTLDQKKKKKKCVIF